MRKECQNLGITSKENTHNTTQHNMIEQAKSSVCVCVCLAEKAKSSSPEVVHTHPDGMLSDKRSTELSTSIRKNMSVRTLHIRS
jgi:hypothetical protein